MGIHEGKVISKATKHCRTVVRLYPAMGMFAVRKEHLLWDVLLFISYRSSVLRVWLFECRAE